MKNKKSIISDLSLSDWLHQARVQLQAGGITSPQLDAEIILAHTIKKPRTYLHAHGDEQLEDRHRGIADARLQLRLDFTPIAYIIGHKEFYGRRFNVTTATLIPRPESETIIELLKATYTPTLPLAPQTKSLVDVGTGSGCLGITAKLEIPELAVTLSDISRHALAVAEQNARLLGAEVAIHQGDLLRGYGSSIDIILANLPYVDKDWEVSRETHAEPPLALYAKNNGLALIFLLITQASSLLTHGGQLFLEADPRQHAAITSQAKSYGLLHDQTVGFTMLFKRR